MISAEKLKGSDIRCDLEPCVSGATRLKTGIDMLV